MSKCSDPVDYTKYDTQNSLELAKEEKEEKTCHFSISVEDMDSDDDSYSESSESISTEDSNDDSLYSNEYEYSVKLGESRIDLPNHIEEGRKMLFNVLGSSKLDPIMVSTSLPELSVGPSVVGYYPHTYGSLFHNYNPSHGSYSHINNSIMTGNNTLNYSPFKNYSSSLLNKEDYTYYYNKKFN